MRTFAGAVAAIAMAGALTAATVTPSDAGKYVRSPYDGLWSVSIYTQNGPCDPSYRYPARIVGSQVLQADNSFDYQISGVVTRAGGISVTVRRGNQSATGYGRLSRTQGTGWWRTAGGQCSGVWNAVRRG